MGLPLTMRDEIVIIYPLVNKYSHGPSPCLMANSAINEQFSIAMLSMLSCQRVFWDMEGCGQYYTQYQLYPNYTGWWFGAFFIFPYVGNNDPN